MLRVLPISYTFQLTLELGFHKTIISCVRMMVLVERCRCRQHAPVTPRRQPCPGSVHG